MILLWTILAAVLVTPSICLPYDVSSETGSLVVSSTELPKITTAKLPTEEKSTELPKEETSKETIKHVVPKIYEMKISTNVTNRFAKTLITSKVKNLGKHAEEATFSIVTPDSAYISGFSMEIGGKLYESYVQEKEEAKKTYKDAISKGQAAGHVAVNARDSNRFTVSVNIEPESKAAFYLSYEELLPRENERYEIVIGIHPGQPIPNLDVDVNIAESRPLKFVKVPSLRTGNEIAKNDEKLDPHANVEIINKTSAIIKFSPDIQKQKVLATNLGTKEEDGLSGQFVVQYDVERDPHGGEVLIDNGFFVHFFAPSDLPPLPKQVVFILDTSGSMQGIRLTQLKEAMGSILRELKSNDIFNIVEFGSEVSAWDVEEGVVQYKSEEGPWYGNPETAPSKKTDQKLPTGSKATEENIKKAKEIVEKLSAFGGTDIQSALFIGLKLVENNIEILKDKTHQPIIVFLTDGEATVGELSNDNIIKNITAKNNGRFPIFSLSFGEGADKKFLQRISLNNLGFARHIYEGADASLQLKEFYNQISSPLLTNVTFKYVSNVSEVTKHEFPVLFSGSEIVVAGQINPGFHPPSVQAWKIDGPVELVPVVETAVKGLERLWAYITLKQILEYRDIAEDKSRYTEEALKLALKYSFVSDVSSLVVVKPNATHAVNTEDASNTNNDQYPIIASVAPLHIGSAHMQAGAFSGDSSGVLTYSSLSEPEAIVLEEEPEYTYLTTEVPLALNDSFTIDSITLKFPWLTSILKGNETIGVLSGIYDLGFDKMITDSPKCQNTAKNSTGTCTKFYQCSAMEEHLTSLEQYEKYFCDLHGLAGVCCPS